MKILTNEIIKSYKPCYDFDKYLSENWQGTILDILDNEKICLEDKLWIILRNDLVSDKLMRLFAIWCYRQTLNFIINPDPRSIEAVNIAEKYANGEVGIEEFSKAELLARSAIKSTTKSTTELTINSSAWSAVWSTTKSTKDSTWSAWSAVRSSVWSVAKSTSLLIMESKVELMAKSAAESAQKDKLKEMIIAGIETGDVK